MGTGLIMPAWRMTGRAAELAQLDAAIGSGSPGGMMLAGPAGTGKTRLLREALHRARRAGRDVAQVAATRSAAAIPFGAVSGLLPPGGPAGGGLGAAPPRGRSAGPARGAAAAGGRGR